MADGSRAIAIRSRLPAECSAERRGMKCPRCEDSELVDCDLCEQGREGCPRCEGLGLIVCPSCDETAEARELVAWRRPEPSPSVILKQRSASGQTARRASHRGAAAAIEKQGRVASPGPQPEERGAAACASRLKWARLRLKMSVEELADNAGYNAVSLRSYEQGRPASGPPLRVIEDLAQALGVRRSWLAFGLGVAEKAQPPQGPQCEPREKNNITEAMR